MDINELGEIKVKSIFVKIELIFYKIINYFSDYKFKLKMRFYRFFKGYAPIDWWHMDSWFFNNSVILLKELRKNLYGAPYGFTMEEWVNIIDKMIEGFEIGKKVSKDEAIFSDDYNKMPEKIKKIQDDYKMIVVDKKKVDEAFILFYKHIFNLWG